MKHFLFIALLLPPVFSLAQFYDDFGDGNFDNNPTWGGDTINFDIQNFELWLNAPAIADTSYASTQSDTIDNAWWEFNVRMDFNPSSSNYARIYLVSDNADLKTSLNGYYVMVGNTADEISLYRQDGLTITEILDGLDGSVNVSVVNARIRVTRDAIGNWTLERDTTGGMNWVSEGNVMDATHTITNFFGVFCKYTSTRSDKFWYDDIFVSDQPNDTIPPSIDSLVVINNTQLDVYFSEWVDQTTGETLINYSADNGIGNATAATRDVTDSSLVHLTFGNAFPNGQANNLSTQNVQDLVGNALSSSIDPFLFFIPDVAGWRDVIINEIMADPVPPVANSWEEFLELHNPTNKIFDLSNWDLVNTTSSNTIGNFALLPGEYVVLCEAADTSLFSSYGNVIAINGFTALTNGGDSLTLKDNSGTVIDIVNYELSWYQDNVKEDGGYSLELINPNDSCKGDFNWIASTSIFGATPAQQNSVFDTTADMQGPMLTMAQLMGSDSLLLTFDEPLDTNSLVSATFVFKPNIGVQSTAIIAPQNNQLWVTLTATLDTGIVYTITVNGLTDCPGNTMFTGTSEFVIPHQGVPGDLLINEILFDPPTGGQDFVEIYNHSQKTINLKDWQLANYDNDTIDNFRDITNTDRLMNPGDFVVITRDSAFVKGEYPLSVAGTFIEYSSQPSFNNDSSTVYLISNKWQVVDKFSYTDDMHFPLLDETEGVSLERLSYDRLANDVTNWHSAAEAVGFATPGYENSQFNLGDTATGQVSLSPEVFSPDNDGIEDVLNINYTFTDAGMVGNVTIYDAAGREVRLLVQNELLGTSGTFSWDGITEDATKARIGIYVVFFEAFDTEGNIQRFKLPAVVASRI